MPAQETIEGRSYTVYLIGIINHNAFMTTYLTFQKVTSQTLWIHAV